MAGQVAVRVAEAAVGAGGVAGGCGGGFGVGEPDRVVESEFDESGDFGVGERDVLKVRIEGEQVPMLELPFEVLRGEGDRRLAYPEGVQVSVVDVKAEFFMDLADPGGDVFAGVVVAADGDVGVVEAVEYVPAGGLLL